MIKNPKAKGSRNERRVRDLLMMYGYYVAKAGGSLGALDLIGAKCNSAIGVQVKTNGWVPKTERIELEKLASDLFPTWKIYQARVNDRERAVLWRWWNGTEWESIEWEGEYIYNKLVGIVTGKEK